MSWRYWAGLVVAWFVLAPFAGIVIGKAIKRMRGYDAADEN